MIDLKKTVNLSSFYASIPVYDYINNLEFGKKKDAVVWWFDIIIF